MSVSAFAQKKKTIGDVLRKIEKQQKALQVQKKKSSLPQFKRIKPLKKVNLRKVKPPSYSQLYHEEGTDEAELERATDKLIEEAYGFTQKFKKSRNRGEFWLRLAELYVEKARLIEMRLQTKYDRELESYQAKKRKRKPKLDLRSANTYNKKAIQLYEWFLRDYPKNEKTAQALFLLGYNYFELGQAQKGKKYYVRLTKEYPNSIFVDESNFSLGEFYFDNEKWGEALKYYQRIVKNKRATLYSFALYKSAWCQYKMGQSKKALKSLERVIYVGRVAKRKVRNKKVSRIRLASEAVKDIIIFYVDVGSYKQSESYFERVVGKRAKVGLLSKLAYYYVDAGNREGAKFIFNTLISLNPTAAKANDYQYQIVKLHSASGNDKAFRSELFKWIENYGENSDWAAKNAKNKKLISKSIQLIESTLRNYILQAHQTAQNSRAAYSQKRAKSGYELYFASFKNVKQLDEMHFFYAELLYDMKEFKKAAKHYLWISRHRKGSKYYERANLNAVLSLEKLLPSSKEVKAIVRERSDPVEFGENIKFFEKAVISYIKSAQSSSQSSKEQYDVALQYRLGSLYYYYNQFELALKHLNEIVRNFPSTKYAGYSANLILDIYNLKKDYKGLESAAESLLAVPGLGTSRVSERIRDIKQKSAFKQAEEKEDSGKYEEAAKAYEVFVQSNPQSKLALGARFNAAVNFERAGLLMDAASMYRRVLTMRGNKKVVLQNESRKFLALIYEKTGQYSKAASAYEEYAQRNPKDSVAIDFLYNAAVIQDGLKEYDAALKNYQRYYGKSRNKKRKDRSEVLFLMGKIWEKRGRFLQAIGLYEKYMNSEGVGGASAVETAYTIAKLSESLNKKIKARKWYGRTVIVQKQLPDSKRVGVRYAAAAKFKLVYKIYLNLLSIRIPAGKTQAAAVQKKLKTINKLKEELASVIKYDDGDQIVAALTLQGQAFQHMANSIYTAPVPKQLKGDDLTIYKKGVDKLAKPFQEQAVSSYKSAIEKGLRLQAYNSWLKVAAVELKKIDPKQKVNNDYMVHLTQIPDRMEL